MYQFWEESPVPMYIRFYLFNVTNSDDVINNKAKPVVEEIGPFTYTLVNAHMLFITERLKRHRKYAITYN